METKIQLIHPAGKKAVEMDSAKYNPIKKALLHGLKERGESSHREMRRAIYEDFRKQKIKFEGSVEWHMEWVKLDLEARKEIKRIGGKSPIKFIIAK